MSAIQGRFIWYELITTDLDGASNFYEAVVGWTHEDMTSADMTYRMVKADGNGVGGMLIIPPEAKAMGAPPSWAGYIAVDDCDASAEKIKSLGGAVLRAPDDIPGIGRFAVVADPQGAVFEIMKPFPPPEARPEFPARGVPGHCSWRELYASDLEPAFAFYAGMFGWRKDEAVPMGPMGTYQLYANQDGVVGGMMTKPPQVPRACWMFYFQVGDIDAAAERVKKAGGQVLMGPMEVPGGDWVLQGMDPQGAHFAIVGTKG
jgi:predicted enzyme related to lactoylglutathione lyase